MAIKNWLMAIAGAGAFLATSMVFIAFSNKDISDYWLILPLSLGFIFGYLESLSEATK